VARSNVARKALGLVFGLLLVVLAVGLGGAQAASNDLTYHGGPTLHSPNVYLVFWLPSGRYLESSTKDGVIEARLQQTIEDLSGTHYLGVVSQYSRPDNAITNTVDFGGSWVDTTPYPHAGTAADPLQVSDFGNSVKRAMATNGWQPGLSSLYLVYTAYHTEVCGLATIPGGGRDPSHVFTPQDCSFPDSEVDNCGGHTYVMQNGQPAAYAVLASPAAEVCTASPGAQDPNHDVVLDTDLFGVTAMLPAMITDPLGTAWYTGNVESGELACATPQTSHDLHLAHGVVPVFDLWSNATHGCALGYPPLKPRVTVEAKAVRARRKQRITVRTAEAAKVGLLITYRNGRVSTHGGTASAAGTFSYSWKVPEIQGRVKVNVHVTTGDGGRGSAAASFRIR
jgi:hypothetical protein